MDVSDATRYKQHIDTQLKTVSDLPSFRQVIFEEIKTLGFTDMMLSPLLEGTNADYTLSCYEPGLIEFYTEFEVYKYDLSMDYILSNTLPIFQKSIDDTVTHMAHTRRWARNQELAAEAAYFQYYDAIIFPLTRIDPDRKIEEKAAFVLSTQRMASHDFQRLVKSQMSKLKYLAQHYYDFGVNTFPNYFDPQRLRPPSPTIAKRIAMPS